MAFGREMMRGVALASALTLAPASVAQESPSDEQLNEEVFRGIAIETCIPEGAAPETEGPAEGESWNGLRILMAINRHFALMQEAVGRGENAEALAQNLIVAAAGCTPQDYDSALRTIRGTNFPQERIDFYTRVIAIMRTSYVEGEV